MTKRAYSWPAGHWGWLIPVSHKHGIRAGRMVYVGGQVDKDIKGLFLHHYDLKTQTRVVVEHIRTLIAPLDRSRLKGHTGTRTWAAWAILAYNLDTLALKAA